jgi:TonB family protein
MESLIYLLAETGELLFHSGWLPLLIWTLAALLLWAVLKFSDSIHPEYHYHARLALIVALPAGFLFLIGVHAIQNVLFASSSEATLKVISVTAPIEIGVSSAEESSAIPLITQISGILVLIAACGALFSLGCFLKQWLQLRKLRTNCRFIAVQHLEQIDDENRNLAQSTGRSVRITFINSDIIPVTFGIRQPVILLPDSLQNQPKKLNLAVRHELMHIHQNDFFSHLMVMFTQSLFWFHPLVHRLNRELIEYRELRCDTRVLAEKSVSRKEYASLLLELLPMPNIDKALSVNMAQESSNLKKRITMITQKHHHRTIPKRASLSLLTAIFLTTALVMACTDMQSHNVFDEEELDLMTITDLEGERGYHQILIILGEEGQAERHDEAIEQLRSLMPEHVMSITHVDGEEASEEYGARAAHGVVRINTRIDAESYNTTLQLLGMEAESLNEESEQEDYFVVVEDMPELIGGLESIQQEIRYPEMARRAGIEGRVYVQFVINEEGEVENPRVIRGIGGGADEEALRVVSQAQFRPGYQRGRAVRVQYSLPIFFRLANSEDTPEQTSLAPSENRLHEMTVTGYQSGSDQSRHVY